MQNSAVAQKVNALQETCRMQFENAVSHEDLHRMCKECVTLTTNLQESVIKTTVQDVVATELAQCVHELRAEIAVVREGSESEIRELFRRSDDSRITQTLLDQRCDSLEERQRNDSWVVEQLKEDVRQTSAKTDMTWESLDQRSEGTKQQLVELRGVCENLQALSSQIQQNVSEEAVAMAKECKSLGDEITALSARAETNRATASERTQEVMQGLIDLKRNLREVQTDARTSLTQVVERLEKVENWKRLTVAEAEDLSTHCN